MQNEPKFSYCFQNTEDKSSTERGSVMLSLWSRCAEATSACIALATKRHCVEKAGNRSDRHHSRLWLDTWRQFQIKRRIEASTSASSAQQERFEIGRSANETQTTKQSRLRKQLSVNDFVQVVRSLTAQRSQEHPSPKLPKLLSKPE